MFQIKHWIATLYLFMKENRKLKADALIANQKVTKNNNQAYLKLK
jgi:hypothetical protein